MTDTTAPAVHDVTDTLTPSRYGQVDTWDTEAILTINFGGRIASRFGLGFVGPEGKCRRVYQGLILPGPYAFAYGLPTVIAADPDHGTYGEMQRARAAGLVIDAEVGDVIVFRGHRFEIRPDHNRNVKLVPVEA